MTDTACKHYYIVRMYQVAEEEFSRVAAEEYPEEEEEACI